MELIKIEQKRIGEDEINSVDARELYSFFDKKQEFANWIKSRIERYDFKENHDFVRHKTFDKGCKGNNRIDYWLSISMAKIICASEISDKGRKLLKEIASKSVVTLKEMMDFAKNIDIDEPDMFIYAMMEEDTGKIKIGISKDPERRLKQLQTGNSSRIVLIATHKAENGFSDERTLHQKNEAYKIHGEWFFNEAKNTIAI